MGFEKVSMETIDAGQMMSDANEALEKAGRDVIERPWVAGERKVTVEITMKPVVTRINSAKGVQEINNPVISYQIKKTEPGVKGRANVGAVENGEIVINADLKKDDDPGQMTIPMGDNVREVGQ
ncbi:MAG: hypothetical protein ABFD89_22670 [Bryobacteraceae bacterium]